MENSSALGGTKQIYTNEARGEVEVQEFGWAEEFDIRWSGLIPILRFCSSLRWSIRRLDGHTVRAYRVNNRFPRNGREAPTRPVSC